MIFCQVGRIGIGILIFLTLVGGAVYSAFYLNSVYREKEIEIEKLTQVVARLEGETRVAQVMVKDQGPDGDSGRLATTIKFVEEDRDGQPLAPRYFTLAGDVIFFDALVIKFDLDYVERGEHLRGKSIALFRRIFAESQAPENGFPIDETADERGIPDIYRVNQNPDPFEQDLWEHFWEYAADPREARRKGVRVIQGEAVYTRVIPDNIYTLTLDHDGGINIKAEPVPAILRDVPEMP